MSLDTIPRPTRYCKVCDATVQHQPVPEDTAHCECRFDGPLPCECACHRETEALTFDLERTA